MTQDSTSHQLLTFPPGQAASLPLDLKGQLIAGIATPAVLTATTCAPQVTFDGVTWLPVYDRAGTAITIALGTSRYIALNPAEMNSAPYFRLVLNTPPDAESVFRIHTRSLG